MKTLLLILLSWFSLQAVAQDDLANPAPHLQVIPGGSYIIAMDNTWQTNDNANPAQRFFNLKSYGLIVHLLNNNVKVKRIIKTGKTKDGVDFTAPSIRIRPIVDSTIITRNFKAGPFVILAGDALRIDVDRLIDIYNNNGGGVSGITVAANKIKVYKTTEAIYDVDIRYDLSGFIPRACILNDGGNAPIHESFMQLGGVPTINYITSINTTLSVDCFTFASEPHNNSPYPSVVQNIKNFILQGGNFLAQCEAVNTYEPLGNFQTSTSWTVLNSTPSPISYQNADIGYAQFEGPFSVNQAGSVRNWIITTGGNLVNGTALIATGPGSVPIGASVSKILPKDSMGGVVFYLGNHTYNTMTDYNEINGIRMYLNAFLTPAQKVQALKFTYDMNCSNNTIHISAKDGPSFAYPITFKVYTDNGTTPGVIDGGDAYVGTVVINTPGEEKDISIAGSGNMATPYVVNILPGISSCYKMFNVAPTNCRLAVLPTSLSSFNVKRTNEQEVKIKWKMENIAGLAGFNIKRNLGNSKWEKVSFIPANNSQLDYEIGDKNTFKGITQYFLEEVALNGDTKNSEIRSVDNGIAVHFNIYPNPAEGGKINIASGDNSLKSIKIYDIMGNLVKCEETRLSFYSITGMRRGFYNLIITDEGGDVVHREKIIVNK